jgi:hypothetical protein
MKKRLVVLANRRRKLLEKIEIQRMDVAEIFLDFRKPLTLANTGLKVVRFTLNHPGLVAGGFAALLSFAARALPAWHRRAGV